MNNLALWAISRYSGTRWHCGTGMRDNLSFTSTRNPRTHLQYATLFGSFPLTRPELVSETDASSAVPRISIRTPWPRACPVPAAPQPHARSHTNRRRGAGVGVGLEEELRGDQRSDVGVHPQHIPEARGQNGPLVILGATRTASMASTNGCDSRGILGAWSGNRWLPGLA